MSFFKSVRRKEVFVYVSRESLEQTDTRLRRVIGRAEMVRHPGAYTFYEFPLNEFPVEHAPTALAFVRDENVWSVLETADRAPVTCERFALFSFHFEENYDNSGFVGWLASQIKKETGAGVFVVCGQNHRRGGIFDYWGIAFELADRFAECVNKLKLEPSI